MAEADGEAFVCGTCFVVLESQELLQIHSSICVDQKPYVCAVCGEVFSEERMIIQHNATHHGTVLEESSDPDMSVKIEAIEEEQDIQDDLVDSRTYRRVENKDEEMEMVSRAQNTKVFVIEPIPEEECINQK